MNGKRTILHTYKFWLVLSYFLGVIVFLQLWSINRTAIQRTCESQNETRLVVSNTLNVFRLASLERNPDKQKEINALFNRALRNLEPIDCNN